MKIILSCALLIILSSLLLKLLPDKKYVKLINPAIMCAIILTLIPQITRLDIKGAPNTNYHSITSNDVWDNAKTLTQNELETQINDLCNQNSLNITDIKVEIDTDYTSFKINKIIISGIDKASAKNLILSTYKLDNINIIYGD